MSNEELFNSLNDEVKKKLSECKTQEEIRDVLIRAGVEPLDDDLVDAVSGGKGLAFGGGRLYSIKDGKPDIIRRKR